MHYRASFQPHCLPFQIQPLWYNSDNAKFTLFYTQYFYYCLFTLLYLHGHRLLSSVFRTEEKPFSKKTSPIFNIWHSSRSKKERSSSDSWQITWSIQIFLQLSLLWYSLLVPWWDFGLGFLCSLVWGCFFFNINDLTVIFT